MSQEEIEAKRIADEAAAVENEEGNDLNNDESQIYPKVEGEVTLTEEEQKLADEKAAEEAKLKEEEEKNKTLAPIGEVRINKDDLKTLEGIYGKRKGEEAKEKEYTPEEIQKLFKPHKMDAQSLKDMGLIAEGQDATPEQVAAFQKFINATVTQAVATSGTIHGAEMMELRQQLAPMAEMLAAQQSEAQVTTFYSTYAGLKGHERAVQLAAQEINHLNTDGSAKALNAIELEVANKAAEILKEFNVEVDIKKATKPASDPGGKPKPAVKPGSPPKMASTASSGRSQGKSTLDKSKSQENPDADIYT